MSRLERLGRAMMIVGGIMLVAQSAVYLLGGGTVGGLVGSLLANLFPESLLAVLTGFVLWAISNGG